MTLANCIFGIIFLSGALALYGVFFSKDIEEEEVKPCVKINPRFIIEKRRRMRRIRDIRDAAYKVGFAAGLRAK